MKQTISWVGGAACFGGLAGLREHIALPIHPRRSRPCRGAVSPMPAVAGTHAGTGLWVGVTHGLTPGAGLPAALGAAAPQLVETVRLSPLSCSS